MMEKIICLIFDIYKNMNIEPMFYKQVIHLQSQNTFCGLYNLKKSLGYMTKFRVVIQKMYNLNKSINTSFYHPKIKIHGENVTWSKWNIQNFLWYFLPP